MTWKKLEVQNMYLSLSFIELELNCKMFEEKLGLWLSTHWRWNCLGIDSFLPFAF